MTHYSEKDLIAYQLDESMDQAAILGHLETCQDCAKQAEAISETLHLFSAEQLPLPGLLPDLDDNWRRLRDRLPVVRPTVGRRFAIWHLRGPVVGVTAAVICFIIVSGAHFHWMGTPRKELGRDTYAVHSSQPADSTIGSYLDASERLLTEVNNSSGPLDGETREMAHDLLNKNNYYIRAADSSGNLAEASVLDNLGRVLTTVDNGRTRQDALQLQREMNIGDLLLDIRILRQNTYRFQGRAS